MDRRLVPHHSHWGAFNAVVEAGRVVGAEPFDFDPDPSPLIEAIPDAVHSPTRVTTPMVRSGWLQQGRMSGAGRAASRSCRSSGKPHSIWLPANCLGSGAKGARRRSWVVRRDGRQPGISTRRAGSCGGFWPRQAVLSTRPAITASGRR